MKAMAFIKEKFDLIKVIITAVALITVTAIFHFVTPSDTARLLTYLLIYIFISYENFFECIEKLIKQPFNENFLMLVATVGAFVLGEYVEAVLVMLLYSIGELFEEYAEERSENAIVALTELMPEHAAVKQGDEIIEKKVDQVEVGDLLYLKAGDRVVCDGVVVRGNCSINASMLTGESALKSVSVGDEIMSGTVVESGVLLVRVTATSNQSSASKIIKLVTEQSEKKAQGEKFIRKFAKIYTPIVIVAAVLVATVPLIFGQPFSEWFKRALNLLVISCPCALVISVPLAYFAGIGNAFKRGIIVKGGITLERASKINKVVFDKTGTLTYGRFRILDVLSVGDESEVMKIAASMERYSNHPIAVAILSGYQGEYYDDLNTQEIAGQGILSKGENAFAVGNAKLMSAIGVSAPEINEIGTVVYVAKNGEYLGAIVIGDSVKDCAAQVISGLYEKNYSVAMLTGDNGATAQAVAEQLGITDYNHSLLPEDKQKLIETYKKTANVAFVGDGINDAPSLASSHLAVAMGSGTDVASLCSDVILTDDDLKKLPVLFALSKKTQRIVKENVVFSISVKVAALVLSVLGFAPMWLAILSDVGVMALATLNSMRLLK